MRYDEKQKILAGIKSEDELRTELVIPLLKKMPAFTDVLDNQGPDEAGIDVIGVSTSPFKSPIYTGFVLKLGDITLKAADKRNNLITIIETQIRQAIRQPLSHPRLPSERAYATHIIVLTNGKISRNAESALKKSFQSAREINLDFVAEDRLIDQIDQHWERFYEDRRPFLSTYAKKLFSSLDVVNLEVLGYSQKQRSLTDIYIDTLLIPQDNISEQDAFPTESTISGAQLCTQQNRLMAVTSGPGGGKTTLLKEIAIVQSQRDDGPVAVYLHAREVLQSSDLVTTAAESLATLSGESKQEIYKEIEGAPILLLVDGLDELASHAEREKVITKLRKEVQGTPKSRAILTSRPESNPAILAAMSDFSSYSISPLRIGQIRAFFGKWFAGNSDKANKLLSALQDKGIFEKLPRTPMTMTLVAIVYESKEDLPSTLTELYQMFVELLTGKWDSNRKVTSAFDSPMKMAFLDRLAWVMQTERIDNIGQDRAIGIADEFLKGYATLQGVDPVQFIQSIIDRSQILVPAGRELLRFSHKTFQEFFCAEYLVAESPSDDALLSWYGDDWWKEVLFFFAGRKRDISRALDILLRSDHSDPETRLTKLVTLGSMLQAGRFTKLESKVRGISFAAERFLLCFDDLKSVIDAVASQKIKRRFTRTMVLGILLEMFCSNFTSTYLKMALGESFNSMPEGERFEGARFVLAAALSRLGLHEPILDFASTPTMIDPAMYLLSRIELSGEDLNEQEKRALKKVKSRMRDFQAAVKKEVEAMSPNSARRGRRGKSRALPGSTPKKRIERK